MKVFLEKSKQIKLLIVLFLIYMLGFVLLENVTSSRMIYTDTWIDQFIPFNEYFVIPYLLWFVFIVGGFLYFLFIDSDGFHRTCFYLFSGMYICLIIYLIFPNGQNLRVQLDYQNIFQDMIGFLYTVDTPTNVCPSIHVYNSIMMLVSLMKSSIFNQNKVLTICTAILAVLICLSTVMIKQHAFVDIVAAIVLSMIIYAVGKLKFGY